MPVHDTQRKENDSNADAVQKALGGKLLGARNYVEFFPLAAGDAVLDVGCGKGTELFAYHFAGMQWKNAAGIDHDRGCIENAMALAASAGIGSLAFLVGDAERLPFADASFDKVLAIDVIQYVPNPVSALGEMARVLKPGGELLITVPAFWHWLLTALSRTKARLLGRAWHGGGSLPETTRTVHAWLSLLEHIPALALVRSRASTLFPPLQRYGIRRFWFSINAIHATDSFFCGLPLFKRCGQALMCVYKKGGRRG